MSDVFIYRYLSAHEAVIAHLSGKLWFHSFRYFRELDDEARRDASEGLVSAPIRGGMRLTYVNETEPTQATYILSFSARSGLTHFGENVLLLTNKEALRERVVAALPTHSSAYWIQVRYANFEGYDAEPDGLEVVQQAEVTKPCGFANEQEWRLVLRLPPSFRIQNDRLELDVGPLDDLFEVVTPDDAEVNYDQDELRQISQMFDIDERNKVLPAVFAGQPRSAKQLRSMVEAIRIPDHCPEEVRHLFDLSRNLYLYSWYVYRFVVPAQAQAFAAMEMALRMRMKEVGVEMSEKSSLRNRLEKAVSLGWIKDGGFPHLKLSPQWAGTDPEGKEFSKEVPSRLSFLRNGFAHGTSSLINPAMAIMALDSASAIITQIYGPEMGSSE